MITKDLGNLAKVQMKYRDYADARLLPKRLPNAMKGKPFIGRLITELTIELFTRNQNTSIDMNTSIAYKISGRIIAGIGGYKRLEFVSKNNSITGLDIHGYRGFTRVKIISDFNVHIEYERFVNNDLTSKQQAGSEFGVWDDKVNFGFYYSYPIWKKFRGVALYLYDLKRIAEFPNTSASSLRFGFSYQFTKRKKSKE